MEVGWLGRSSEGEARTTKDLPDQTIPPTPPSTRPSGRGEHFFQKKEVLLGPKGGVVSENFRRIAGSSNDQDHSPLRTSGPLSPRQAEAEDWQPKMSRPEGLANQRRPIEG